MSSRKSAKHEAPTPTTAAINSSTRNRTMNSYFAPKGKSAAASTSTAASKEEKTKDDSTQLQQVKASPKSTRSAQKHVASAAATDSAMTDVSVSDKSKQKSSTNSATPRSPSTRTKRQASIESDASSALEMQHSPPQAARKKQKLDSTNPSKPIDQAASMEQSAEKMFASLANSSDSSDSDDSEDDDMSTSNRNSLRSPQKKQKKASNAAATSSPPKTTPQPSSVSAVKPTKQLQQRTLAASASGTLTTVVKQEEFFGEDPAVLLSNLLTISREMHEFRELFRDKMIILKQILLDTHIQSWSIPLVVQLVAQLLTSWMQALPTSRMDELTYRTEGDPAKRKWHTSHVALIVNILQILTQKLHDLIQHSSNGEVRSVDEQPTSSKRPISTPQPHFTPAAVVSSIQIIHLCEARFSVPEFWGSGAAFPPSTPNELQSSHFQFFTACCEWLHVSLPHLIPLLAEQEKERLRKWLLHIATHEMKHQLTNDDSFTRGWHSNAAWAAKQRLRESKIENEDKTQSTDSIVTSSLLCCNSCTSSKHPKSHFLPSLSLPARAALLIFQQTYAKEKFSIDSANRLSNLLQTEFFVKDQLVDFPLATLDKEKASVPSAVMKLSFLRSIASPPFRLYCIILEAVQLLNSKEGLSFILTESQAKDAFVYDGNRSQSHSMLAAQLTLLHEVVLQCLTNGYQKIVKSDQGRLHKLAASCRLAAAHSEASVWEPKREAAVNANKNLSHTKPSRPTTSIATAFARQAVAQAEKVTLASMTKAEKAAMERQRDEEMAAKKREAAEAVQQSTDAKAEGFIEQQQQYSHLLSILLDTINEQMHQHINECKSSALLQRNTSTTSIVSATTISRQASADVIVSDSQPSSADAGASSTDGDASQSSHRSKKEKKEPSLCVCYIDSHKVCNELRELYQQVHSQIHHMQGQVVLNKKL